MSRPSATTRRRFWPPSRGTLGHHPRRALRRTRLPLSGPGCPTLDPETVLDRRAMRFTGRDRLESGRHGAGDPRCRPREGDVSNERTGIIMGRAAPRPMPSWRRPTSPAARVRSASARSRCRRPCPPPPRPRWPRGSSQGRELFDLVRLRDVEPLHRQRRRDHPGRRQDIIFAGGCEDWIGRSSSCSTPWAPCPRSTTTRRLGPPAPTMRPRRLRHRRRRGRGGAGGVRARQGARRADLR